MSESRTILQDPDLRKPSGMRDEAVARFLDRLLADNDIAVAHNQVTNWTEWRLRGKKLNDGGELARNIRECIPYQFSVPGKRGRTRQLRLTKKEFNTAIKALLATRGYNPHREWLESLPSPNPDRKLLERALVDPHTFAADDTPQNRAWLKLVLVGAIMRIYEPGARFRFLPALVGARYWDAFDFIRGLVPNRRWSGFLFMVDSEQFREWNTRRHLISMLDGLPTSPGRCKRLNKELAKRFYEERLPYEKTTTITQRTGVVVAIPESEREARLWNKSPHFIPLRCNRYWGLDDIKAWLETNREQLWAEAKAAYDNGYRPHLNDIFTLQGIG